MELPVCGATEQRFGVAKPSVVALWLRPALVGPASHLASCLPRLSFRGWANTAAVLCCAALVFPPSPAPSSARCRSRRRTLRPAPSGCVQVVAGRQPHAPAAQQRPQALHPHQPALACRGQGGAAGRAQHRLCVRCGCVGVPQAATQALGVGHRQRSGPHSRWAGAQRSGRLLPMLM